MVIINGEFNGLEGKKVFAERFYENKNIIMDSSIIKDGKFSLSTTFIEPFVASIKINSIRKAISVFISSPGSVDIDGTTSDFKVHNSKGKQNQATFGLLQKELDSFFALRYPLFAKYGELQRKKDEQGIKELANQFNINDEAKKNALRKFIKRNSKSPVSIYALSELSAVVVQQEELEPYSKLLPIKFAKYETVKLIKKRIESDKKAGIGKEAPPFTQSDANGNPVSLVGLRGKYVLLDFWASWCVPCRKENPNLVAVYNQFSSKGFTILSVSLDRPGDKQKWVDAINKDGIQNWYHVSDLNFMSNAAAKLYAIQAIPQNFLIDPNGKIVAKNVRGEDLSKKLEMIYK